MAQNVYDLLGEDLTHDELGEDLQGGLISGYIPDRSIVHVPAVQLGDGLAGPPNDQQLVIARDNRPIATDELGQQGPWNLNMAGKLARHRAGRQFPLNYEWNAGLDQSNPGLVPQEDALLPSVFDPSQSPSWYVGDPPAELTPTARTVYFTATPTVGWEGY